MVVFKHEMFELSMNYLRASRRKWSFEIIGILTGNIYPQTTSTKTVDEIEHSFW